MRRRLHEYVIAPGIAILVTLVVLVVIGGALVLLEPRTPNAAPPTTAISNTYAPTAVAPGRYGSGVLGSWDKLLRRISPEDQVRDVLNFNGIFMFGDSIAVQDGDALEHQLAAGTGDSIAVHNWSGQPTSAAVDALAEWSQNYGLPDRILMAVGTNDIFDPPAFGAQVERAMNLAGPDRTVYWVNVEVSRFRRSAEMQAADRANSAWINQQLEEAAQRHPNLRIIHWAEFLANQPEGLGKYLRDGVHTTEPVGRMARNDLILEALQGSR